MENGQILEHKGSKYVVAGDRALLVDHFDENGKPVVNVPVTHPGGPHNTTVHVGYLQIVPQAQTPGEDGDG